LRTKLHLHLWVKSSIFMSSR